MKTSQSYHKVRNKRQLKPRKLLVIPWILAGLIAAWILNGCAGSSEAQRADHLEKLRKTVQYKAVRIGPFVAASDAQVNLPPQGAITDSRLSTIASLRATGIFGSVEEATEAPLLESAMIVQAVFTGVRIEGESRIWGGFLAPGPSSMQCHVRLIDGKSRALIHEQDLEAQNNTFYGAHGWGNNLDRDVPFTMGKVIADYVLSHAADTPPE